MMIMVIMIIHYDGDDNDDDASDGDVDGCYLPRGQIYLEAEKLVVASNRRSTLNSSLVCPHPVHHHHHERHGHHHHHQGGNIQCYKKFLKILSFHQRAVTDAKLKWRVKCKECSNHCIYYEMCIA